MNNSEEKEIIYQLMQAIMTERRQLTKQYFDLKDKLDQITDIKTKISENDKLQQKTQVQIRKETIENDKYFLSKKDGTFYLPYSKIALQITHILKNSGIPLTNKQIYEKLVNDFHVSINYSNLSNNILPRMNTDSAINVEKITRGFWQYKLNN